MAPLWYSQSANAPMNTMRPMGRFQYPPAPASGMQAMPRMGVPTVEQQMHQVVPRPFQNEPPRHSHPYPMTLHREAIPPSQGHPYHMMNRGLAPPPVCPPHRHQRLHAAMLHRQPLRFGPPPQMHAAPEPTYDTRHHPGPAPPLIQAQVQSSAYFLPMKCRPARTETSIPHGAPPPSVSTSPPPIQDDAHPPPLRETLVHNILQDPTLSEEQARKAYTESIKTTGSQQREAFSGILDAASALISMKPIIEKSEADSRLDCGETMAPATKTLPTRLALPEDNEKLNAMHCFLRAELLELFVVEKTRMPQTTSENSSSSSDATTMTESGSNPSDAPARIGLRCVHCAYARRACGKECDAPMSVFYPKSLAELYRLVTSWQRVHLRKCRNLPKPLRETFTTLRLNDKSRGKTHYWVTSAKKIGLIDNPAKSGGIIFAP